MFNIPYLPCPWHYTLLVCAEVPEVVHHGAGGSMDTLWVGQGFALVSAAPGGHTVITLPASSTGGQDAAWGLGLAGG